MNYRHAYHAGNFADVLKHAVLALAIEYLKRKDAPFRIVDVHAGRGRYDLSSVEAEKTGEWRSGIARLIGADAKPLPPKVARSLSPYLNAVRAENPPGRLDTYPGSPVIARRLLRDQDVLVANELHPDEYEQLKAAIGRDQRTKVMALDAWIALRSLLPPKERRGIVLIDPPFEARGELTRLADGLAQAWRRFSTGIYLAWYPIKDPKPIARFEAMLARLAIPKLLRLEFMIRRPTDTARFNGCGLVMANPPYTLAHDLAAILPELKQRLAQNGGGRYRLEWLSPSDAGAENARARHVGRTHTKH